MAKVVLDASAVLALIYDRSGAKAVAKVVDHAAVSAVTLQVVYTELLASGIPAEVASEIVRELRLEIRPHDAGGAMEAAKLGTAELGIEHDLEGRSSVALAIAEALPIVTANAERRKLKLKGLQVKLAA